MDVTVRERHEEIAASLARHGYAAEEYCESRPDMITIWPADRSKGFVEVTVWSHANGYSVLCPVDCGGEYGLIEVHGSDVWELVRQLNEFYATE